MVVGLSFSLELEQTKEEWKALMMIWTWPFSLANRNMKKERAKRQKLDLDHDDDDSSDVNGSPAKVSSEGLVWKSPYSQPPSFDACTFGAALQKGFSKLYNDPLFSDLTLVLQTDLGEERIRAHKVVSID